MDSNTTYAGKHLTENNLLRVLSITTKYASSNISSWWTFSSLVEGLVKLPCLLEVTTLLNVLCNCRTPLIDSLVKQVQILKPLVSHLRYYFENISHQVHKLLRSLSSLSDTSQPCRHHHPWDVLSHHAPIISKKKIYWQSGNRLTKIEEVRKEIFMYLLNTLSQCEKVAFESADTFQIKSINRWC